MHEFSLVRSLLSQIRDLVADQGGGIVQEVRVQCGTLSGVEPALLHTAFIMLRADTLGSEAELILEEIPLHAHCNSCRQPFEPQQFHFICPHCGSTETEAISGDRVILESIVLEAGVPCHK